MLIGKAMFGRRPQILRPLLPSVDTAYSFQFRILFLVFRFYREKLMGFFSLRFSFRLGERTAEDQEIIYEELLHIKALSHLSNSVKRELAAVLIFESHPVSGTVRKLHHTIQGLQQNMLDYFHCQNSKDSVTFLANAQKSPELSG